MAARASAAAAATARGVSNCGVLLTSADGGSLEQPTSGEGKEALSDGKGALLAFSELLELAATEEATCDAGVTSLATSEAPKVSALAVIEWTRMSLKSPGSTTGASCRLVARAG